MRRHLVFLLVAATAAALPSAASAQRAILVVRHAEKQSDSNERAVPLSEAGRARARRLAELLKDTDVTAIYSTDTERTKQTAEPLAQALKLEIKTYDARDADGRLAPRLLVDKLRRDHAKDVVLVIGHSDTLPGLLKALGHPGEIRIASNEFNNLLVVLPKPHGPPVFLRLRY